jgi:hypothetical protein
MGPSFLQDHPEWVTDPFYNALLDGAPQTEMKVWLFAMPLIIYAVPVMVFLLRAFKISNIHVTTNFSFITLAFYQSIVLSMVTLPWWSRTLQAPVHDLAMMFKEDQRVVVQWGVHLPSFATYRQQESPRREPKPGELALVKNIQPFWPSDWEILAVRGPLAVVKSSEIAKSNP